MAVALDASVIRAINKFARTPMGRKYDRFARKRYGIQGKLLMAKTVAGENGGRGTKKSRKLGIRSSAGAFGPAQFIPSTREAYIEQYHVDPWHDDFSAMKAMAIHHMGTGVEGYNPGMPTYKDYILGQRIDKGSWRALKQGASAQFSDGRSSGRPSRLVAETTRTPGVDLSGERDALRMETLTEALSQGRMPSQSELLALGSGLRELKDIPAEENVELKVKRGKRPRARGGRRGSMPRESGGHFGEIFEAFYDPAGEYYDEGSFQKGGIGGHSDHVHVSASPKYVVWLGKKAQRMGLRVSENPAFDQVDPVHTQGSYHYSKRAIDVSGSAEQMAKFYGKVMKRARNQNYRPHNR